MLKSVHASRRHSRRCRRARHAACRVFPALPADQGLAEKPDEGEWKPGELIPSEVDLATRFQVSRAVRKAVDELAAENPLVRRQGKGTFVATIASRGTVPLPARSSRCRRAGVSASRFVECRRLRAPADIARQLDLRTGDAVVYLRRLLSFGGDPIVLDEIWLPGALFKGLTAERLAEYKGPLYGLFETEFGTRMIRAEEQLRAVGADRQAAQLLGVAADSPLLLVERVSYSYGDRPVEVRRGLCVTEHYHYRNTLS
jgi:GntR family transcriptional regulator